MPKLAKSRARRTKKPAATKSTNGKPATVRQGTKQALLIVSCWERRLKSTEFRLR